MLYTYIVYGSNKGEMSVCLYGFRHHSRFSQHCHELYNGDSILRKTVNLKYFEVTMNSNLIGLDRRRIEYSWEPQYWDDKGNIV